MRTITHIVEAEPGTHIHDFAVELVEIANRTNAKVTGHFNEYSLTARPGDDVQDVINLWLPRRDVQ